MAGDSPHRFRPNWWAGDGRYERNNIILPVCGFLGWCSRGVPGGYPLATPGRPDSYQPLSSMPRIPQIRPEYDPTRIRPDAPGCPPECLPGWPPECPVTPIAPGCPPEYDPTRTRAAYLQLNPSRELGLGGGKHSVKFIAAPVGHRTAPPLRGTLRRVPPGPIILTIRIEKSGWIRHP